MKRTPLKAVGHRGKQRLEALATFRDAVLKASGGFCERCRQFHGDRLHAHHRRPRSLGGTDHVANGVAMCAPCHLAAHTTDRKWIDSHNRSLALDAAPPTPGAGGHF